MRVHTFPLDKAYASVEGNPPLRRELSRWTDANTLSRKGLVLQGKLRRWLEDPSSNSGPDLVEYLYDYAYVYVILRDWTELPIEIPESDYAAWREWAYTPTLGETQARMMAVLGGFLKLSGQRPDLILPLMERQVTDKLARLKETLGLSLDEHYTPHILTPEEIEGGMGYHMGDERRRLNEPFNLFDQLSYFALGLEDARLHCFDEKPNLGLPNVGLFGALCEIDLPALLGELDKCEAGLKRIQRHLAKLQDDKPDTDRHDAPDEAWWRHWKPESRQRQQRSRSQRKK